MEHRPFDTNQSSASDEVPLENAENIGTRFSQNSLARFGKKMSRIAHKKLLGDPLYEDEAEGIIDMYVREEESADVNIEATRLLLLFEGKTMQDVARETGSSKSTVARLEDHAAEVVANKLNDLFNPSNPDHSKNSLRKKPEYDPFATPLLNSRDSMWLTALMTQPPTVDFLKKANVQINISLDASSIRTGSLSQDSRLGHDLEARFHFFEMLGWTDEQHPLNESLQTALEGYSGHRRLPPLENFVFLQRLLAMYKIHPAILFKQKPTTLFYDPQVLSPRLKKLHGLDVNLAKLSKEQPPLLSDLLERSVETLDGIVSMLDKKNINVNSALERFPDLLKRSKSELRRRINNLDRKGLDHAKVVNRRPEILDVSRERVNEVIMALQDMGLNAQIIVNRCPAVLLYKVQTLQNKAQVFQESIPNWKEIIHARPQLFESNPYKVVQKFNLIYRLAHTLRWEGSVEDLLLKRPEILQIANSKLFFLGALAANHLDEDMRHMSVESVGAAVALPVANHLLAASRQTQPYSLTLARRYNREMKPTDREFAADKTLQNPDALKRIGSRVVKAYLRHTFPKSSTK